MKQLSEYFLTETVVSNISDQNLKSAAGSIMTSISGGAAGMVNTMSDLAYAEIFTPEQEAKKQELFRAWKQMSSSMNDFSVFGLKELLRAKGISEEVIDGALADYGLKDFGVAPKQDTKKQEKIEKAMKDLQRDPEAKGVYDILTKFDLKEPLYKYLKSNKMLEQVELTEEILSDTNIKKIFSLISDVDIKQPTPVISQPEPVAPIPPKPFAKKPPMNQNSKINKFRNKKE